MPRKDLSNRSKETRPLLRNTDKGGEKLRKDASLKGQDVMYRGEFIREFKCPSSYYQLNRFSGRDLSDNVKRRQETKKIA
jgi:hypothetical protein